MVPATSERNFTPNCTALSGPLSTTPGTAPLGQIVTGEFAATVMPNALVAVCPGLLASLTCAVKLYEPVAVGVPLITPLLKFNVRPVGKDPLIIAQPYGRVPPLAVSVAE